MIFILIIYFFLSFFCAYLIRNLIKSFILKKFIFALVASLFMTFWFSTPGELNLSPIFSISIMELLEFETLNYMRILRPFLVILFLILFLDLLLFKKKI